MATFVDLVSISGACSRSGKTAAAVSLLRAFAPARRAAVKFTTTEDVFERCPRGTACVVCDIDVPFRIVEDAPTLGETGTDTARLIEAGAGQVLWAIARASAAARAWAAARERLRPADVVVMEGSTIVALARPHRQVFVAQAWLSPERWKPTSPACIEGADLVVVNRPAADPRPPAPEVLAAIDRARPQGQVVIADVTRPASEWAAAVLDEVRA